ncbi:kelch-like protein 12 [Arctopsyche grandis]|uniref:kelch-like protein 12 n=1 Tax=Arctopsyche grandis TaxID=121162 RepID=UPI00406D6DE8
MSEFNGDVSEKHAKKIFGRLFDFHQQSLLCNIDLVVGNNRFPVPRLILVTNSDYLKSRINDATNEIVFEDSDDIHAESVRKTIKFFYFGEIYLQPHQAENIIKFSKMVQVREIEEYCLARLEKITDNKNYIFIEDFAKQHGYLQLLEKTKAYIAKNYLEIIQEDEFLNMSCERLSELLQSNDLNVVREEQAFQGLKIWMQNNYESRKRHVDTLLKYIRLPLLPAKFILNEVRPLCYDSFSSCEMLLDTFEYHHSPEKRPRLSLNSNPRKCSKQNILIIGGQNDTISGKIEIYDAYTDKWSTYYNLNYETSQFEAVVLNNKLITMGGIIGRKSTNKVSCLDLVTKERTELQAMQEEKSLFRATVIDDQVFVIGGLNSRNELLNSVERYDLVTHKWTNVAHMSTARYRHATAGLGKKIFAIGGRNVSDHLLNTMEIYDTHENKWTAAPPMRDKRDSFSAVAMGDYVYAIGGYDGSSVLKSVERFDIKSQTWTSLASLPVSKRLHEVVAFDERIICVGGLNSKSMVEYDPDRDKWTDRASISEPRHYFNLLFLLKEVKPLCYCVLSSELVWDILEWHLDPKTRHCLATLNSTPRMSAKQTILIVGGSSIEVCIFF